MQCNDNCIVYQQLHFHHPAYFALFSEGDSVAVDESLFDDIVRAFAYIIRIHHCIYVTNDSADSGRNLLCQANPDVLQ